MIKALFPKIIIIYNISLCTRHLFKQECVTQIILGLIFGEINLKTEQSKY